MPNEVEIREIDYVKALREVAILGVGRCTLGRPLQVMIREALAHADSRVASIPLTADAVDIVAEALWQAESERAAGRRRLIDWTDESEKTRETFRHSALAAIKAYEDVA